MGWKEYGWANDVATGRSEIRKPFGWICGDMVAANTADAAYKGETVRASRSIVRQDEYLNVDKLDKGKTPASQRRFVFDEDNPLHTLRPFFMRARGRCHREFDCLRSRQRIQPTEEEYGSWGVADVTCTVVRIGHTTRSTPHIRICALGIVDFDTAAGVLPASLDSLIKGGGSGRAMRSWRWNLYEGKLRVHESARSLDRSELGKTEALGLPCEDGEVRQR